MVNGSLSAAQEAILVDQMLKPDTPNSTATIWRIRGTVDVNRLLAAIKQTFEDIPALHLGFETDETSVLQAIPMPVISWSPEFHDVSETESAEENARERILGLCSTPFDLAEGNLFRVAVVRIAQDDHILGMILHHVLTDAYGVFDVLSQGIANTYRGHRGSTPIGQAASPVAAGLREDAYRESKLFREDARFWQDYLSDAAPAARLPKHGIGLPAMSDGLWDSLGSPLGVSSSTVVIPRAEIASALSAPGTPGEVSFPDLVMASVVGFISRVCDIHRFTFSFTVNFRHGVYRKAPGLYSNAVPMNVAPSLSGSTMDLARKLSTERLDVLQHAEYNVALMKRVSQQAGGIRSPFGPVVNVMPFLKELDLDTAVGTLDGGLFGVPDETMISVFTDGSGSSDLFVRLDAPEELYSPSEVRALSGLLAHYLRSALQSPETAIGNLELTPEADLSTLTGSLTDAETPVDIECLLINRAAESPEHTAVTDGESSLTNSELTGQAQSVCQLLKRAGVTAGDVVALSMPPCLSLVPVQLGLAMSGAATAPLAPGASLHSLADSVAANAPTWLVSLAGMNEIVVTPLVDGDPVWGASMTSVDSPEATVETSAVLDPAATCYVVPGASLTRSGLQALALQTIEAAGIGPDDVVAVRGGGWGYLCAVLAGASIVILPHPSPQAAVTVAFLRAGELADWLPGAAAPAGLRAIVHGKEPLPSESYQAWTNASGGALYTGLSPSAELPPFALMKLDGSAAHEVLAGCVAVLDSRGTPVGHGLNGRLHAIMPTAWAAWEDRKALGEWSVTLPDAGSETSAFGLPLLGSIEHDRLRLWGDSRRIAETPSGTLSLTEVDRVAESIDGVAEAASRVLSAESSASQPSLTLYVAPSGSGLLGGAGGNISFDASLDMARVRTQVGTFVAGLATIGDVIVVESIPRTAEGLPLLDALPVTAPGNASRKADTEQEQRVADLFRRVLGRSEVAAGDDFFQLGGDSIMAMRLASLARQSGLTLAVRDVFEHRTVENLAQHVTTRAPAPRSEGPHESSSRQYPLPPVAYVFDRGEAFNRFAQWMALTTPPELDQEQLTTVLQRLLDRHDALRSRRVGSTMHVSEPGTPLAGQLLEVVTVETDPAALTFPDLRTFAAAAIAHVDASQGDLVRFVWIQGPSGTAGLLVPVIHHLVIDGVSWQVVLDDLAALHHLVHTGRGPELASPPVTFAEWTHHLYTDAQAGGSQDSTAWGAFLEGFSPNDAVLDPHQNVVGTSDSVHLELDPSLSRALGTWVPEQLGCNIEDLLLAAYVLALPESKDGPVIIRLEGHGRDGTLPDGRDAAQTVGWFTSIYPLRIDVSDISSSDPDPKFAAAQAIIRTRQGRESLPRNASSYALLAYAPQELPGADAVPRADRIGFNYLGRFGGMSAGRPWSPAAQTPVIVAAPDWQMPLASVLNLDTASLTVDGTESLVATFDYATRHLSPEAVEQIAGRWSQALTTFRDLAAEAPQMMTQALSQHISGKEWSSLTQRFVQIEDIWPLTPLQHGLYYHWLRSDSLADAYQMQFTFTLEGEVDTDRLGAAVESVVRRLPNLRVVFVDSDSGEPLQLVLHASEASMPYSVVDLQNNGVDPRTKLSELLTEERRARFDLSTAPPLRFTTYLVEDQKVCLSLSAHHILLDGWSLPLLLTEILRAYAQEDGYDDTPDTRFESALRRGLAVSNGPSIAAWEAELSGVEAPLLVPPNHPLQADEPGIEELGEVNVAVPRSSAVRIAATAAEMGVTSSVLLQAAWALTLSLATGSEEIVFGNTVAVRPSEVDGSDECIGMLTNTIPVRVRVGLNLTLAGLARRLQETSLRMMDHWHVGLGDILATTNSQQLFNSVVVFESFPVDQESLREASRASNVEVTGITPFSPTHYPYTLLAAADPVFSATIQYRGGSAHQREAERLAECLTTVVSTFVDAPATRVAEIERVTSSEHERLVRSLNETAGDYPNMTVAEQFATTARTTADNVAVIHGASSWTYADLDQEANRICHWLQDQGVQRGDKIAVAVPRSMTCLAAILGIWHAGSVYVPVDPKLPESRFNVIIDDSAPLVVITQDVVDTRPWRNLPTARSQILATAADSAYAFFTSGSTGRPQGVLVGHDALSNFLTAMQALLPVSAEDRWLSVTTISFDISLLELFQPLLRGAAVVIADDDDRTEPETVWDLVRTEGVTTMQATPSLWRSLCNETMNGIDGLRALVGGEALDSDLAERLSQRVSTALNVYGPTETTIWSTCAVLPDSRPPSIGRPIQNTQVYVLDQALRPLPVGQTGELWIAGAGLALGYFNSPTRTASRFVANPFTAQSGARMYRTGDLARWTFDGEIEFLGRNDTQVKLRGFRIELAEVERLLARHPDVKQAQVCLQTGTGGVQRLVAYLVLDDPELEQPREFTSFLDSEVPEHMRPAVTVILEAFQLNDNGKIDRNRLPDPEEGNDSYVGPSSGVQATLCRLFAEVLSLERVGVHDEFVALGGHSLIATRLVSRIRTELGVEVPIRTLFTEQTIDRLSARWHEFGSSRRSAITRSTRS